MGWSAWVAALGSERDGPSAPTMGEWRATATLSFILILSFA